MTESTKEKWIAGVALTTTLLAVLTALASFSGASYVTKAQLQIAEEANRQDTFLADSIKEHSYKIQMEVFELSKLLGRGNPEVEKFIEKKVKEYNEEIANYEKEKEQVTRNTDKLIRQQDQYKRHNATLAFAIIFLQAAILISSIGMLVKKRIMWYVGLCCGIFGFFTMIDGFFLWF